jgi:LSD1 subclass zinc finger protein
MARQAYVLVRCAQTGRAFMGCFVEQGERWNLAEMHYTEVSDPSGGRQTLASLTGQFGVADEFAGCPDCKNQSYVRCGSCRELACWSGDKDFRCIVCNARGVVTGGIKEVRVDDFG